MSEATKDARDTMRDSDRARLALMLLSWQVQQADGLTMTIANMERARGLTDDPHWKGLGSDRWAGVLKRTADALVALAEENADWFNEADAVSWEDQLLNPICQCLFIDGGKEPES